MKIINCSAYTENLDQGNSNFFLLLNYMYMIEIIFNSPFSANTTKYTCDFEKAMHCGISQITDDRGEFLMMNGSYLREKILYEEAFNEHTNNDSDGTSYKQSTHVIKICLFWFSFQKCFALYFLLTRHACLLYKIECFALLFL